MKKLSDFKDSKGIEVASRILSVFMEILTDERNRAMKDESNPVKLFTAFMANSPDKMREVFAILSEKDVTTYHCNGAEAMVNMLILANDPVVLSLFISQGQTGDAKSSGSVSENTEE